MPTRAVTCSVVVPVYNEEQVVETAYRRLRVAMDTCEAAYELLFVDDGSRDRTPELLEGICRRDERVQVIRLSRNFGHQAAMRAGLAHAAGRAVVFIDGDLQDPPELIPAMIRAWRRGHEVVYGRRVRREGESVFKRWTAAAFYRVLRRLTSVDIPLDTGDFRLIDRRVADVLLALPERRAFLRGLVPWVGFDQVAIRYTREPRLGGRTKYSPAKMVGLALDAVTSFSDAPLRAALYLGLALGAAGLVELAAALLRPGAAAGTRALVGLVLGGDGLVLAAIGVLGQYTARIYDQVRGRPPYVVRSVRGLGSRAAARPLPAQRRRRLG